MNAAMPNYGDHELNYRLRNRDETYSSVAPLHSRRSNQADRRRTKAPTQFNGIHRRRHKRIAW